MATNEADKLRAVKAFKTREKRIKNGRDFVMFTAVFAIVEFLTILLFFVR